MIKNKAPQELELLGASQSDPTRQERNRPVNKVPATQDSRTMHLRNRRIVWWTLAAAAALVVLLADNSLVTTSVMWIAFAVVTRLEVVDRRRSRRAAHRATLLEEHAVRQAIALANMAHRPLAVEVAA